MADAYGNAFVNQYGTEPNPSWMAGLSQFTDLQIQEGYTRAIQDNREFCPNLSTLIGYIQGDNDWESKRLHKPWNPDEALPDLGEGRYLEAPKDDRTPEEHMAELREIMGIGR